jgi:hypothetical protein
MSIKGKAILLLLIVSNKKTLFDALVCNRLLS